MEGSGYDKIKQDLLAKILKLGESLRNTIHEGQGLDFLFFIGQSTHLVYFRELYTLSDDEVAQFDCLNPVHAQDFIRLLKSHYSHLQEAGTGFFISIDRTSNHRIVQALPFDSTGSSFAAHRTLKMGNLEERLELCQQLTKYALNLGIARFGMGSSSFYLGGRLVLSWPDTTGMKYWSPLTENSWNSEEKIESLIKRITGSNETVFKSREIGVIKNAILHISAQQGEGAIFLFVKNGECLKGKSVAMNPRKLNWVKGLYIQDLDFKELYNLSIMDGGTLINIDSGKIDNQQQIVPIDGTVAYDYTKQENPDPERATYGVRHSVACDITAVVKNDCIAITISEDGPISVFYNGKNIGTDNLSNINF